jgi:hypothetical protein
MARIDAFLHIASRRMNRRQAGVVGAMLLTLLARADPAIARTQADPAVAHKRTRNAKRERAQSSQDANRRQPCGGIAGLPCPDGFICVDDPSDDCDPATGGADCFGICVRKGMCGGIAGIPCPAGFVCIDDPRDDCDPAAGGADCPGICVRKVQDPCATIRCRQGTKCCPNCGGICIPDDIRCSHKLCVSEPCNQVMCGPGEYCCNESCSRCVGLGQGCTREFCPPEPPPGEPCGRNRCEAGEYCCNPSCGVCAPLGARCAAVVCDPEPGGLCGGIAGIPCPDGFVCVDDPGDECDPSAGGFDCPGICIPIGGNPCAAILCLEGTTCCPECGGMCIPPDVACSEDLCVSEPCNQAVCGPGEFCCNESCSICAPLGGGCIDQFCEPPGHGIPCGPTFCPVGQVCCNESCGICTPPDGVCIMIACVD